MYIGLLPTSRIKRLTFRSILGVYRDYGTQIGQSFQSFLLFYEVQTLTPMPLNSLLGGSGDLVSRQQVEL